MASDQTAALLAAARGVCEKLLTAHSHLFDSEHLELVKKLGRAIFSTPAGVPAPLRAAVVRLHEQLLFAQAGDTRLTPDKVRSALAAIERAASAGAPAGGG